MTDRFSQLDMRRRWPGPDLWTIGAALIAVLVLSPIAAIVWIGLTPTENIWPHLMATVLPRYLATTLGLMLGVAVLTAAMGTGAAWLVSQYRFPGRDWLAWALLFPLAIPAYVGAYALVDFLDYAGPCRVRCARPLAGKARATTGSRKPGRYGRRCWCCPLRFTLMSTCWPGRLA